MARAKNPTPEQLARYNRINQDKQARKRARDKALAIIQEGNPQEVKESLSSYLFQMGLSIQKGDARQMWLNFIKYKQVCDLTGDPCMPMTVFMVMGLSTQEVIAIMQKRLYADRKDIYDVVSKVVTFVLADVEQALLTKDIDKTTLIWYQKNFAAMTDFPEQAPVITTTEETMTPEQIADKYKNILK